MTDSEEQEEARPRRRPRKERVLHTRVPEVLEKELKRLADSFRVPVSNVVRTILEDAVDAIDAVGERAGSELQSVADALGSRRQAEPAKPPLAGAIGVADIELLKDSVCGLTGRELKQGERAWLVHFDDGRPPLIAAPDALPKTS